MVITEDMLPYGLGTCKMCAVEFVKKSSNNLYCPTCMKKREEDEKLARSCRKKPKQPVCWSCGESFEGRLYEQWCAACWEKKREEWETAPRDYGKLVRDHDKLMRDHSELVQANNTMVRSHDQLRSTLNEVLRDHSELFHRLEIISNQHDRVLREHGEIGQRLRQLEKHGPPRIDLFEWSRGRSKN